MNFPTIFLSLLVLPPTLFAAIESFFNPCPNKSSDHKILNRLLDQLGVTFEKEMDNTIMGTRYPAEYEGKPLHEMMQVGKNYFSHCISRGAIGAVLSHLFCFK